MSSSCIRISPIHKSYVLTEHRITDEIEKRKVRERERELVVVVVVVVAVF